MFGTPATMPFVPFPLQFGWADIGPIIHVDGIGRMDTGDRLGGARSFLRRPASDWLFPEPGGLSPNLFA
jgi:hypothetical protein